jgi:hypothetical protein
MQNASDKLLKMIKKFKKENKSLMKKYNEQTNVIDEYLAEKRDYLKKKRTLQNENRVIQNENVSLQNEFIDQKFVLRIMKQKLETFEIAQNRTRNARDFITSLFVSSLVDHFAEMIADINVTNRFEKTKRSVVILDSTIFIENKAKFEH